MKNTNFLSAYSKTIFPTDDALVKMLYPAMIDATKKSEFFAYRMFFVTNFAKRRVHVCKVILLI